ncbi:Lgr1, partial [Drosophila busckii]
DLSSTSLVTLPSVGLQTIEELLIMHTHTLKTIPSIYNFKNLERAHLTHSFHCCAFRFPSRHDPQRHALQMAEMQKWRDQCNGNARKTAEETNTQRVRLSRDAAELGESTDFPGEFSAIADDYMGDANVGIFHEEITINRADEELAEYCGNFTLRKPIIECFPVPNELNPCEDVMGYQWLRIAVWIVVGLAVVGNVAVLTVNLSIKAETPTVPRFLICHLAFADLCLGLYLLFIASIDAHSMGEYFNYAFDWQYGKLNLNQFTTHNCLWSAFHLGLGCKVAGFLTVFATHLGVFTLTVITIERWLAITHALDLNQRIRLRDSYKIMLAGWTYSIIMSSMPLFGISNYSSTSICLPMERRDVYDSLYLMLILGSNFLAFLIIAICYTQIYFSLDQTTRNARQTNSGEMSIAKKMALLVFTNFTCWAPIAFFGLTALAGYPLINVSESKILLVLFFPLNACADPYLYAILTSQYRDDLVTLMSKLGLCRAGLPLKYRNSISMQATASSHLTVRGSIGRQSSLGYKGHQILEPETQKMLKSQEAFV